MPENQAIYNIGKQDAGRDIFNIFIQHLATGKQIILPSIKSVLKKGETEKGDFFKTKPEWVDFEQGYIVERKEVINIINKLDKDKIQLVLGAPASGKSLVLKNVGYKLANKNKNVYMIELKGHPEDDIKSFFENIPTIIDAIFIVDDAHLYLPYCEKLAAEFRKRGMGKLIIGSRDSIEITKKHPKEGFEYESLNDLEKTCIRIVAEDATEDIIRTFLEKQNFDNDRIKTAFKNLADYKKDLWFLSWALKSYNNSVNMDDIYEMIRYSIEDIRVGKEKEGINAEDVFLPLSIFYRYEIPIDRDFLEEELGIEGKTINKLVEIQEVVEKKGNRMLSLNHSSLAELYLGAYKKYDAFGKRIKKNILNGRDEEDLEYCIFYRYIAPTDPKNAINIVISLHKDFSDEKGGLTLLRKLLEKDNIQKSIETGINREDDLEKIGQCVKCISEANENISLKLIDSVASRIDKEEDIRKIGMFFDNRIDWTYNVAFKLAEKIDLEVMSSKLDKEEDIQNISFFLLHFFKANKYRGFELVEKFDMETILLKIYQEDKVEKIGYFLSRLPLIVIDSIDINFLSLRIDKEEDIEKIGSFINDIAYKNEKAAMELLDSVSLKINTEEDIEKIGLFVRKIARSSEKVAFKLVDIVSSRINTEEDIKKIAFCVDIIADASEEVAFKLVENIDLEALLSAIDKEENISNIGICVAIIAKVNVEKGFKLIDIVSSKINNEEDIEKIGYCVRSIAGANKSMALKLVDIVSSRIDKEENILKIGNCVKNIANGSREMAMKLVDRVSVKIDKEDDIEKIVYCISLILQASKEMEFKLMKSIDIKSLCSKINNKEYLDDDVRFWIRKRILYHTKLIDINALSSKIGKEQDIGKIGSCVSDIAKISKEVALK